MAIFIPGASVCPICHLAVGPDESVVNFPPLFVNEHHAVFEINDSVVHRSCLGERPYSALALAKLAAYEGRRVQPKVCGVCGRAIGDPDDYFGTGPLADDPQEAIARLDWFEAHVRCLVSWEGTSELARELRRFSASSDWEGSVLEEMAGRLDKINRGQGGGTAEDRSCGGGGRSGPSLA